MNNILSAKHWHLFLALFVAPFIIFILAAISADIRLSMLMGSWLQAIFLTLFSLWLYLTGKALHQRFPKNIRVPFWLLPVSLLPAIVFMVYIAITETEHYLATIGSTIYQYQGTRHIFLITTWLFASIAGMFYALYFVARSVNTVEAGEKVSFSRWITDFFLLLFFPIGIWFFATRLNRIAAAEKQPEMDIFG